MAARKFQVEFVGGTYDGAVAHLPDECDCCGEPVAKAGGTVVSPFGELYDVREMADGRLVGEYAGLENHTAA